MSTTSQEKQESKGVDVPEGRTLTAGAGKDKGDGSTPLAITNPRESLGTLRPQPHGGALKQGNPGPWPNSGRKPERLRIMATEGVEELLPDIIASTKKQAKLAGTAEGSEARAAHAEAVRGFKGLVEAGPGTKVTNVVERDGYHDAASRAYDQHDGTKLGFLEALKAELDAIP